jgi:hypothetical protein
MNKKILRTAAVFIIAAAAVSCKAKKEIQFCEGASTDGKGVKCGTVFEYGDLSALITAREEFGTETITVQAHIIKGSVKDTVLSLSVKVKPDSKNIIVNLPLYKKGKYEITALSGEKVYAKGEVEIAD